MMADLEHRNAICTVLTRPEKYNIRIRPFTELLLNQVDQLILYVTRIESPVPHASELVLLIHNVMYRIRKMRVIYAIEDRIDYQPLTLFRLAFRLRHRHLGDELNLFLRERKLLNLRCFDGFWCKYWLCLDLDWFYCDELFSWGPHRRGRITRRDHHE